MSNHQPLRLDPEDPTKTKVQTRDGSPARILAIFEGQQYPIIGLVKDKDGEWWPENWTADGHYQFDSRRLCDSDLVNAPNNDVMFLNIYPHGRADPGCLSREEADYRATPERIACVRVEWKEGQFDE